MSARNVLVRLIVPTLVLLGTGVLAHAADLTPLPTADQFQRWRLSDVAPTPSDNPLSPERIRLGKKLFFDTRLSGDGDMSCGTCHDPRHGWSDGLPTARGHAGKVLSRRTPTVINAGFNAVQMWDGRFASLEEQALGPMNSRDEMHSDMDALMAYLRSDATYVAMFWKAYPGETISPDLMAKAIASFERTVVVNKTRFDQWVEGNPKAMSAAELRGLQVFMDPKKGNCEACHSAPNFTDSGFHNIGLASFAAADSDQGRFAKKPLPLMRGAFKTPSLRGIPQRAPYFHDGSAPSLRAVIDHYVRGGDVKTNLSPNLKPLTLSEQERDDLLAFLGALSAPDDALPMTASTLSETVPMQSMRH